MNQNRILFVLIGILNSIVLFSQNNTSVNHQIDNDWNNVRNRVLPILKGPVSETKSASIFSINEQEKPLSEPFIVDVIIMYSIENEDYRRLINKRDLENWNISLDSLRTTAVQNLDKLATEHANFHGDSTYALVTLDGSTESSLMLSQIIWPYISNFFNNNKIIVGIPARDVFILASESSKESMKKLIDSIKAVSLGGDHLITKWTFTRENNKWITYKLIE